MEYILLIIYLFCLIFYLKNKNASKLILVFLPIILSTYGFGLIDLKVLNVTGAFQIGDITLLYCIIYYFITKRINKENEIYKTFNNYINVFILFLIFQFIYSVFRYEAIDSSFKVFRIFFRYFSLVFFLNEFLKFEKKDLNILFEVISYSTLIFSFFFIINYGFNIKIFGTNSALVERYYDVIIYRNFLAIPSFLFFTISYTILRWRNIYEVTFVFALTSSVLLLVYTRSYLIIYVIILLLVIFIRFFILKSGKIIVLKRSIGIIFGFVIVFYMLLYFFDSQAAYFLDRFNEIYLVNSYNEVANAKLRENIINSRVEKVVDVNIITGLGYLREDQSQKYYSDLFVRPYDTRGQIIVGDQSWGSFIAANGFFGLFILLSIVLTLLYYIIKNKINDISIFTLFLAIFAELLIAFVSENLISDGIFKFTFLLSLLITFMIYYEK